MNDLEALVGRALRDPLEAARRHAAAGGRVVGYAGAEIPVEIILASGAFALRLPVRPELSTASADRYLESGFSPESRSLAAQYIDGAFAFLDAAVLPRSNDSLQRLYYYVWELQARGACAGPAPLIFDLAKLPRIASSLHTRRAAQRLAAELGTAPAALPAAIERRNRRRSLFSQANRLRADGYAFAGSTMERIFRAADCCEPDEFDAAFAAWLSAPRPPDPRVRLVLAGNSAPDDRLHRAVELAGGNVVAEYGEHAACAFGHERPAGDSLDAIADHYWAAPIGSRAIADRAEALLAVCRSARTDGVVIWLLEQEDAQIWDVPAQRAAVESAGLPILVLTRRSWLADDGALERIAEFTRDLGATR